MDIDNWKELIKVVECGSLTLAADELGYTLSGISRSMTAIEKEVGFQLLYRGKRGVTPTEDCERILPHVRELVYASNRLSQAAASIRGCEEGEIGIGTAYRRYYRWLTEVTSQFHEQHPGVHFRIYNGTSTDFVSQLEHHKIDFCIISEREGTHEWYPICEDSLVALLPVNHTLAGKDKIPLNAFEKESYIATCPGLDIDSSRFFKKYGIKPNMQFSTMDIQATYAMVDAGMGISMTNQINSLPDYSGVCHRNLEITEKIEIGLACEKDMPPAAREFLHFVSERLPK